MKYLAPITLLFLLCSCENNAPTSKVITTPGMLPEKASAQIIPDYLNRPLKGKVSQAGLYRMVRNAGLINDPSTSTGKSVSKPVIERIKSTERIPLIKGAQMYLQYRIWPLPKHPVYADIRRVLKHPEITLPNGKVSTGSDFMIKSRVSVNQAIGYTGYGLDEDYELVEGDWFFEIWYQDKKIIEQSFTTYRPDKEEIAKLSPLLRLGNKVLSQQLHTEPTRTRLNWPKIVVGGTKPTGSKQGLLNTQNSKP